jgi:hypothetical protein
MAKQPNRSKPKVYGQPQAKAKLPWLPIAGGVAVVAVAGIAWSLLRGRGASDDFDALIAQGKPALSQVINNPDHGRGHEEIGKPLIFAEDPPTSGIHWSNWTTPGVYTAAEPKEKLVHALEHGNIVAYYDQPEPAVRTQLETWTKRFSGQWDGMVMVPRSGIGKTIELTAWTKVLRLDTWDAAAAAAFIDAYRGRGPENPVR